MSEPETLKPCPWCGTTMHLNAVDDPPAWMPKCDGPPDCPDKYLPDVPPEDRQRFIERFNRRESEDTERLALLFDRILTHPNPSALWAALGFDREELTAPGNVSLSEVLRAAIDAARRKK